MALNWLHHFNKRFLDNFSLYYNKFTFFDDNSHLNLYNEVMKEIRDFGIFEKIMIVFENKDVLEFDNNKV